MWNKDDEVDKAFEELPPALFRKMQGDEDDFYRHSMGHVATACQA